MTTQDDLDELFSRISVGALQGMEKALRDSPSVNDPDTPIDRMTLDALRRALSSKSAEPLPN